MRGLFAGYCWQVWSVLQWVLAQSPPALQMAPLGCESWQMPCPEHLLLTQVPFPRQNSPVAPPVRHCPVPSQAPLGAHPSAAPTKSRVQVPIQCCPTLQAWQASVHAVSQQTPSTQ